MKMFCKLKAVFSAVWAALGACVGLYDRHITEPVFAVETLTEPEMDRFNATVAAMVGRSVTHEGTPVYWTNWTAGLTFHQAERLRRLRDKYLDYNRRAAEVNESMQPTH